MACTEAYKEHIMYTFHGFCKVVIRNAAITAWRDRQRQHKREISLEYLIKEKFYPLGTTDEYFIAPYEEYPVTICGQTIILTNGKLAAALLSLPEQRQELIYLYFFKHYRQWEIGKMYRRCRSTAGYQIHKTLKLLRKEMEFDETGIVGFFMLRNPNESLDELRFGFVIINPEKRGKGYGKMMLRLGLKIVFEIYGAKRAVLGVFENNFPAYSCRANHPLDG